MSTSGMRFLREQTGPIEDRLKAGLVKCFAANRVVKRAYLVEVAYSESTSSDVALCLTTTTGADDPEVVDAVSRVFRDLFGKKEHMDVLFIKNAREAEIMEVCPPFYVSRL